MPNILEIPLLIYVAIAVLTHLLRLVFLFFKVPLPARWRFLSEPPDRGNLVLYYLLVILTGIYIIYERVFAASG